MVKLAAARANYDCKQFSKEILTGIEKACKEIMDGKLHDQFAVDLIQGGAGTSTYMAANEVIANRALRSRDTGAGVQRLRREPGE
jgi:aspartate ammonia-lyase